MRLLNCRTKKLEEFVGAAIPRYAILSHAWEDDEVLFRDIALDNVEYKAKKGWHKIERSCEQALRDGLNYVWVDTICIDKSSSAELSEAINSMFKWYRSSAVCYAYLCDLPEFDLERSRWFTRGWTLQEMIAPGELWFYDRNWVVQGSKSTLLDKLQEITGVDTTALQGGNLRFFSVARKMSWASKRQTTREEDIAYCLLGIFDISMPLLYGEGSKAFIRLQEEIIKEYDDESLFAWRSTALGHSSGLLAPSPAAFSFSANIVPCLTRAPMLTGPITVTSRGIRLEVPVEQFDEAKAVYLVRLNCKAVSFEWSLHNVDRGFPHRDPPLTAVGSQQASNVHPPAEPDLIIVSPMTRTIQTALIVFRQLLSSSPAKVELQVWPDLREAHDAICNKGVARADMAAKFSQLDFSACHEEWDYPPASRTLLCVPRESGNAFETSAAPTRTPSSLRIAGSLRSR
ncbi:hypothetical protein DL770_002306 [Monosporascus sp. CRB-9-2]|nr:hypothetical protein DL770_002306 [Monosporascus sp. CRB-9-2]